MMVLLVIGGVGTKPSNYLQNHNWYEATISGKPDLYAQKNKIRRYYRPGFRCICFKMGISFLMNTNSPVVITNRIAIELIPITGLTC